MSDNTRLVNVRMGATLTTAFDATVEVPADLTDEALLKFLDGFLDGSEYETDPNSWERGEEWCEKAEEGEVPQYMVVVEDGALVNLKPLGILAEQHAENVNDWVVIVMEDGSVSDCWSFPDSPQQMAIDTAIEAVIERADQSSEREHVDDVLRDDGRYAVGEWCVHVAIAE